MEARFRGKNVMNGPVVADMKALGKRTLDWDLNDWKWDGDLLLASPLNHAPSDCKSRQFLSVGSDIGAGVNVSEGLLLEISPSGERGKRELDKRRRSEVVGEDIVVSDVGGSLNLMLGDQLYPIADGDDKAMEGKSGKKSKVGGSSANQPVCQVEDCGADLSNAKDYHRRHKVCPVHSKAGEALVGNVMQRFCQQCSRFHVLQEFDEGKRSCRRRLAGHNKRRRKTHPETSGDTGPLANERSAGYLLISLLRILSNLHTNGSDQSKDQDLLSHLLRNLAGPVDGSNISELIKGPQSLLNAGTSTGNPEKDLSRIEEQYQSLPSTVSQKGLLIRENQAGIQQNIQEAAHRRCMPCGIDLNNVYDDSEDCVGGPCSFWAERDVQKSSPPTSRNSDSTYGQSSSSGSEAQSCTDRIVFKLFGKDPSDLPHALRTQILDWLSHSPTDIEGYIRPGCIVLTIYLRLNKSLWSELCCGMNSRLSMLLDASNDPFWKTGWIYTRVRQRATFVCDGQVVLDTPLPFKNRKSRILSISPLAVPAGETVQWVVRGFNLAQPTSRLLCAIEGRYLVEEGCSRLMDEIKTTTEQDDIQSLSFCCSTPDVTGRGFIEVEDYGLTGCFFPFIVAEPDICSEICMLEKVMDAVVTTDNGVDGRSGIIEARHQAIDFIHEMGWLLHRNRLSFRRDQTNSNFDLFPFIRIKSLFEFSMDHDWCAVLKKLLDLVFSGIVDSGEYTSIEHAVSEMALLHAAVRKNSQPLVELLLMYEPKLIKNTSAQEQKQLVYLPPNNFFFRPDTAGAGGLTPLHIAACTEGSENILEALLEDPGLVGIEAWKNARDNTGMTPSDYASLRGHYSYINMAHQKIKSKSSCKNVVIDIPSPSTLKSDQNKTSKFISAKVDGFYTEKVQTLPSCRLCLLKPDYGFRHASFTYRPVVLSLVAIAVVCVCAALLFKSLPHVGYVFEPFKWENLKYGSM